MQHIFVYNGLLTDALTHWLQSVQNAAARLVMGTRRCNHMSPVLCQLHWLPVWQCVMLKIVTLVYQSLSSNAPGYLDDDCQLVTNACVRQLHSADTRTRTLVVSRTHSSFRDRTFAAERPQVWNSLSPNLRTMWAVIWPAQAVTGDIFIRTVRPLHSVNCY